MCAKFTLPSGHMRAPTMTALRPSLGEIISLSTSEPTRATNPMCVLYLSAARVSPIVVLSWLTFVVSTLAMLSCSPLQVFLEPHRRLRWQPRLRLPKTDPTISQCWLRCHPLWLRRLGQHSSQPIPSQQRPQRQLQRCEFFNWRYCFHTAMIRIQRR